MDAKTLEQYINSRPYGQLVKYREQTAYYKGINAAILADPAKADPDNRKPIPFARRLVKQWLGYFAKPGNITLDNAENIQAVYDANDEALKTNFAADITGRHGVAYEIHWTKNSEPRFACIPVEQGLPIYSDDLEPELVGFIWYRTVNGVERATVYDSLTVEEWSNDKGWALQSQAIHGYQDVPVVCYAIDPEGANLFDHILPLIDMADKVLSEDYANELQRFAAAYMRMVGNLDGVTQDDQGLTQVDHIKASKIFDQLEKTTDVDFLERNPNGAFTAEAMDRVERLIYEMAMMFNPNDPDFLAGGASGVAMAYKLLGFEYLVASTEAYFSKGLYRRAMLVNNILSSLGRPTDNLDEVQLQFRRNLPFDMAQAAQLTASLMGVWDIEAILNLFPANVLSDEAKARILAEKAEIVTLPEPDINQDSNQEDPDLEDEVEPLR